jgi:hypothetical protein
MRKVQVDEFFEFSSAREKLREDLDNGASGVKAYAGVSPGYAELFSQKQVHNVDRSADPPTKGFLILATSLLSTCGSTSHSYDLLVLHYSLWRTVAGAVPFALLVGFVYAWTPLEENRIRDALQLISRKGPRLVSIFVGRAYSAIRTLQYGLMNASASKMDSVLNTPTRIKEKHPRMWLTLSWPGRTEALSSLWSIAPSVTATRTMHSKERLTQELARAPLFGTCKAGGVREPGFWAKEIAEYMSLTTFFPKQPADTNTYQVMAPRWHQGMTGPRVFNLLFLKSVFNIMVIKIHRKKVI